MRAVENSRLAITAVLLAAATMLGAGSAQAQSAVNPRFPHSHITSAEWQTFLSEVKAKPGAQEIARLEEPDILVFEAPSERALYFFTSGGPAHPAVVVEQVIETGTRVALRDTGYFAGSEAAFVRWFDAFPRCADALRNGLEACR